MPDYSNSIIYKLCCKDPEITDIYIGSTTNFRRRKCAHKYNYINKNSKKYNMNVYKFIREHGNWDNWDMVQIESCNVANKRELEVKERYWIEELKSSLNSYIPTQTIVEYRENNKEKFAEYRENNKEKFAEYREKNKEHIAERTAEYREKNKEKIAEKVAEYREKNKEKIAEKVAEYYQNNKEHIAKYNAEYREKNKEKIAEKVAEYYQDNKEKIAEKSADYYQDNKEKIAKYYQEKNAIKVMCECGSEVAKYSLTKHKKSKKHNYFKN